MKFFLVNILDAKKWEQHKNELKNVDSPSNSISASQEVFMRILSQEASSVEFHQRLSTAQGFFGGFQNILAEAKNTSSNSSWQNTLWTDLSTEFGSFFEDLLTNGDYVNSKIFETVYTKISRKLTSELIDDLPISENRGLSEENNYIEYLKNERLETIKNDFTAKNQPSKSIFFTMMSHALFMQYWDAAMNILTTAGQLEPETSPGSGDRKNYLHFNGAGTGTVPPNSKWYFLFSKLIGLRGASGQTMTMAEFLQSSEAGNYKSDTKHLREMFEALDVLSKLSTAKIERAFAEHVDLCTYRLDAWQLGMEDKRMTDCRNQDLYHKGIYLGSSGYLENLKPGGIRKDVNGNSIVFDFESGTESPIAFDPENQGYVHGPSIPHAVTAAILRGGYTAHKNETTTNNAMAVNLSSERVRKALNLIDGIRGGQQLSALLGYQFERGLHDNSDNAELDQYILDIRLKFPLVANKLLATNDNSAMDIETLEARNVVDGLALLSASQKTPYPYGISLPLLNDPLPAKAKAAQEIKAEIDRLADSLDALGDLLMSESVFQLAKGNHERSNSVMNALSKSTHIPEPEIVKTPRTGHSITHRVIINFEPLRRSNTSTDTTGTATTEMVDLTSANYNPWASANIELTMRAKANLSLNKWLGKIFGDPNKIQTVIRYTDPTNQTEISDRLSVAELKIQPIDLLHFMSSDFDLVDTKTDLGRLITYYGKRKLELQENIDLIIDFSERDSLWANDILTLFEMAPLASNLMKTIAESRALHPDDIVLPGSEITEQGGVDIKELETRLFNESNNGTLDEIEQLLSELQLAKDNLELDETFDAQLFENIRELLLKTYILGFGNRFNYPVTNDAESKLFYKDEIQIMINKTVKIYKKARSLYSLYTADSLNKEQILLDIFKLFYGKKSFPIIEFLKNNPSDFNLGILEKPNTSNTTIMKWISGITKVRKKIMNYNNLNSYFSLLKNDELKLEPIQLCTTKLNYWVGMEFPVNPDPSDPTMQPPKGDVLSLVLENNTPGFDISNGMIIDDWVEMIPIKEVTTGVAFHYDQPNAKPPQSLIMAVTPEIKGNWSWKNVIDTIIETMELAKKRAVEPDELAKTLVETETVTNNMLFSHILPCVLTEISQKNVTISGNLNAALDAVS